MQNWEEKFESIFDYELNNALKEYAHSEGFTHAKRWPKLVKGMLKDFIHSLLSQQKEEILKIITEEIARTHSGKRGETSGLTAAFNSIKREKLSNK